MNLNIAQTVEKYGRLLHSNRPYLLSGKMNHMIPVFGRLRMSIHVHHILIEHSVNKTLLNKNKGSSDSLKHYAS